MNTPIMSGEPQTVIVTTKNTASLTLGIIAIVVGVLSLLVGWIPFLGLLAMPTAIIGILLAVVGFIIALFKQFKGVGMPVLGGAICFAAFIVPILSTGGTSAAITKAMQDASKQVTANAMSQQDTNQASSQVVATSVKNQENMEGKMKTEYIQQHIVLYDVQAKYMDSVLNGKVPGVLFKIRNAGDRSLDRVKVTVTFKDANGTPIHDQDYYPVAVSDFSLDDNKPLKPAYIWQMEAGKFYTAKSVPSEWKEGSLDAKITDIEFSKQ